MNSDTHAKRGARLALAGVLAVAGAILALAFSGTREGHATTGHQHDHGAAMPAQTDKELVLHDGMRMLWEQHVAWTRLTIVSFAAGNPDLAQTQARLLQNQVDIGNAIKPYYGQAAGKQLTRLLKEHITGAVAVLVAAKAGDTAKLTQAKNAWYVNGRQVADFLSAANPSNWPRAVMRSMMKAHLDQTLNEAVAQLTGKYGASVRQYDAIEHHILAMADALSSGIAKQFPDRFS